MINPEKWFSEQLGFIVKDKQIQSSETRINFEDKEVPKGVRPATEQEIKLWDMLMRLEGWVP